MYIYLSIRSSLFIIPWAKLLHKLVKTLYCELSFQITCILPNLPMSDVVLKQLLQVFSSSLSPVQMKDKMVLICLKLKQNSFKPLKQSMFTFTTKACKCFRQFEKMHSEKTVQQKRKMF